MRKRILELHQQYGDMVRVGPNEVSVNGTIGWPEVFGLARSGKPEFAHWDFQYNIGDKSLESIFTTDKENHRRQRRLMAHAFSDAAIKEQEALVKKYVDKLFDCLRKDAAEQKPTDVVKWYNFTTFDIIGDLVFGESFHCLDDGGYHPWVAMIFTSIKVGAQVIGLKKMPLLTWAAAFLVKPEDMRKRIESKKLSKEKTARRVALGPAPNGRKDIMTYILRHNDERGMSATEINGNSDSLIIAGSETTATALSGLTYFIAQHPQALERVNQEIRTAFASEDDITMQNTAQLKYLHACIEEALRMYPPVPEMPPRLSPGDFVNGHYMPKGVSRTPQPVLSPFQCTMLPIKNWLQFVVRACDT
jgi:cytochrome P450